MKNKQRDKQWDYQWAFFGYKQPTLGWEIDIKDDEGRVYRLGELQRIAIRGAWFILDGTILVGAGVRHCYSWRRVQKGERS